MEEVVKSPERAARNQATTRVALEDRDDLVLSKAIMAFVQAAMHTGEGVAAVWDADKAVGVGLCHESATVRRGALEAVAELPEEEIQPHVEALEGLLDDDDHDVQMAAVRAIEGAGIEWLFYAHKPIWDKRKAVKEQDMDAGMGQRQLREILHIVEAPSLTLIVTITLTVTLTPTVTLTVTLSRTVALTLTLDPL